MRRDRKSEPHVHPARIMLYGRIEKLFDLGKGHYLIKSFLDLGVLHPEDRPIQIDVFPSGQFVMEAGPNLKQASYPAANAGRAFCRFCYSRKYFQQRRFTGAVAADYSKCVSLLHFKTHILKRPKLALRPAGVGTSPKTRYDVTQRVRPAFADVIKL